MSTKTLYSRSGSAPYSKALKVKVVASEDKPLQYRGKDGSARSSLTLCVSDGESVLRLVCYDPAKFQKFKVGATLLLREVIKRQEEGRQVLIVTSSTRVLMSTPMDVPEGHTEEGRLIIRPPPAEKVEISSALRSPLKKRLTISGKIVQEDEPRKVDVRGEEVYLKNVYVEDASGKAKVTLWREVAEADVRPGDHVNITDVVVNMFNNTTSLSTTQRTKIEKCTAPTSTCKIEVEAIGVEDGKAELFTAQEETLIVSTELLMDAFYPDGGNHNLEEITLGGPVALYVTRRGVDVVSIEKV